MNIRGQALLGNRGLQHHLSDVKSQSIALLLWKAAFNHLLQTNNEKSVKSGSSSQGSAESAPAAREAVSHTTLCPVWDQGQAEQKGVEAIVSQSA